MNQFRYQILEAPDAELLAQQVNAFLNSGCGWQLQGGVSVTQTLTATIKLYSQALIKTN